MFDYKSLYFPQFMRSKADVAIERDRLEPEFGRGRVTVDVNVRWFA